MKLYLAAALFLIATSSAAIAAKSKELVETFTLEPGQSLRVDIAVGDLRFEAGTGQKVEVDLRVTCKWGSSNCDEALADVHVASYSSSRRLSLEIDGYPKWHMKWLQTKGTIRLPVAASLDVDMGVGAIEIEGLAGDQRIDLGVGDVKIWANKADIHSVAIDAGVGETNLHGVDRHVQEHRSMFVGSELYWSDGPGEAKIKIDVGVGAVSVWLE